MYSLEFKRLGGVTQVASATEGHVFHNRLTHSLKVSQLARRLAEHLRSTVQADWPTDALPIPECAAAAALAHDLGHPPFGHVAEEELGRLTEEAGDANGFEGNAQSFRIVTRLAAHRPEYFGLDLMPRTLNGILKYPWQRGEAEGGHRYKKFGVYECDADTFARVRPDSGDERTIEAQIMDMADDITYAVHDLHDFWRAGIIPVDRLRDSDEAFASFIERWKTDPTSSVEATTIDEKAESLRDRLGLYFPEIFTGVFSDRARQDRTASVLIGTFFRAVSLKGSSDAPVVEMDDENRLDLRFLQRLTWDFVITNPRLRTQQAGQRKVVHDLFTYFLEAAKAGDKASIPERFSHLVAAPEEHDCSAARVAADAVSGLSDAEAQLLFRRISGISEGSMMEPLPV